VHIVELITVLMMLFAPITVGFAARDVVNTLKLEFGKDLHVDLLVKHIDNSGRLYKAGVDKIDYHIPEKHTRHELMAMLGINDGATP
jgi:pyruvate formate-lyase activating enzyme-like uncharacterized protein